MLSSLPDKSHPPSLYSHHISPSTIASMDSTATDFRAFYPYTPNEVKHRKRTTNAQLKTLESIFKRNTKPNGPLRVDLAAQLGMTPRGVQASHPPFSFKCLHPQSVYFPPRSGSRTGTWLRASFVKTYRAFQASERQGQGNKSQENGCLKIEHPQSVWRRRTRLFIAYIRPSNSRAFRRAPPGGFASQNLKS